jgi:archaellum biogenesis ATPase FlaH
VNYPGAATAGPGGNMVLEDIQTKSIITGNADIDGLLGRGFAIGSLALLEGPGESGKSLLAQHFAHHTLTTRTGVAYYTSEGNVKAFLSLMSSLDLDVTDYFLVDRLRIYSLNFQVLATSKVGHFFE